MVVSSAFLGVLATPYRAGLPYAVLRTGLRARAAAAADRNMSDKLDEIRKTSHWLRQDAITAELLDVVIGSEAILEPASR
jgi:F0F1-type ATP synthase gamma subunit